MDVFIALLARGSRGEFPYVIRSARGWGGSRKRLSAQAAALMAWRHLGGLLFRLLVSVEGGGASAIWNVEGRELGNGLGSAKTSLTRGKASSKCSSSLHKCWLSGDGFKSWDWLSSCSPIASDRDLADFGEKASLM